MASNKNKKKRKEIIGWIFVVCGLIILYSTLSSYFSWQKVKKQYIKVYSYSDSEKLYYEKGEDLIEVNKIYDTYNEVINLKIPNEKSVEMYCNKQKNNECIYINQDNSIDTSKDNPVSGILVSLLFFALAFTLLYKKIFNKSEEEKTIYQYYLFYLFIFLLGIYLFGTEINKELKYKKVKKENNLIMATIDSELYNPHQEENLYKPIAYYYVDDKKYIFVNDFYINGTLEKDMGQKIELYYNKENPNEVYRSDRNTNYLLSIAGLVLIILGFPFVFFTSVMQSHYSEDMEKNN